MEQALEYLSRERGAIFWDGDALEMVKGAYRGIQVDNPNFIGLYEPWMGEEAIKHHLLETMRRRCYADIFWSPDFQKAIEGDFQTYIDSIRFLLQEYKCE